MYQTWVVAISIPKSLTPPFLHVLYSCEKINSLLDDKSTYISASSLPLRFPSCRPLESCSKRLNYLNFEKTFEKTAHSKFGLWKLPKKTGFLAVGTS